MKNTSLPTLPCMCSSFRRSARALTQCYQEALRPLGLHTSQFTILQVLSLTGGVSQGQLGQMLAMDSTTLTRTLRIMLRQNWIAETRGEDRRERRLGLAKGGERLLGRALPIWEKVQLHLQQRLGPQTWKTIMQLTNEVTQIALSQGERI